MLGTHECHSYGLFENHGEHSPFPTLKGSRTILSLADFHKDSHRCLGHLISGDRSRATPTWSLISNSGRFEGMEMQHPAQSKRQGSDVCPRKMHYTTINGTTTRGGWSYIVKHPQDGYTQPIIICNEAVIASTLGDGKLKDRRLPARKIPPHSQAGRGAECAPAVPLNLESSVGMPLPPCTAQRILHQSILSLPRSDKLGAPFPSCQFHARQ